MEKAALVSCVNVNLQAQSQIDKDKDKTRTDRVEFGDETGDAGVGLRGGLFGKGSKSVTLASGRGSVFVGSSDGTVAIANHTLSVVFAWRAHEASLSLLRCLSASNTLVSVGEDAAGIPFLRIWNLDKIDKATRCPLIMRSITIQHNNRVFPVTALAILETLSQIAIGLENGVVLLIRGDIANPERLVKPKQIWEGSQVITGLGFKEDPRAGTVLYITTPSSIFMCNTTAKEVTTRLGDHGAEIGCAISTPPGDLCPAMVVARTEGIYFYDINGRGSCFMIDGEKTLTSWFKNYLVIVSRPQSTAGSNQRAKPQVSSLLAKVNALNLEKAELSADEDDDRPVLGTVLTVYDLRSKCIAFQGSFELSNGGKAGSASRSGIVSMACEWDELFVVTADQKMYKLEERDMSTRLDILFQKNMYTLALAMVSAPPNSVLPIPSLTARTQSSKNLHDLTSSFMAMESSPALLSYITDPETRSLLIEIHKRYADHLYSKGDFEAAMTQYLHTLGHLEPSYVIRKYLDAQRIHLLVQFLQALHMYSGSVHGPSSNAASGRRLATPDHTTLLINCYTKLQAADRLDEFLRRADVQFDVDNAIRVCRAAGFYEHALYLSERFGVHEWYLHIQVEDLGRHAETVEYIMGLSPAVMESCLRRYGHVLVKEMVKEMIDVLVVLCTTKRAVDDESSGKGAGMIGSPIPGGEDEDSLTLSMMGAPPSGGMIMMDRKRVSSGTVTAATVAQETTIPFPEDFIHLFVDMDAWCVMFLERVLEIRWGISLAVGGFDDASQAGQMAALEEREEKSLTVVCNTLLEMCLNLSSASAVSQSESDLSLAESRRAKAMHLLQHSKTRYDLDHALILCQINKFQAGIMYLYERMQMYNEILEHYMTNDDYSSVIEFCIKFGSQDVCLWQKTLTYFADKSTDHSAIPCESELTQMLDEIDKRNLMSPLQVIQILSQNPGVTIGTVRKYLLKKLETENKHANESEKLVKSFQEETEKMKSLIHELKTAPVVFQSSKCSLCAESLELPSIHFMCKHSYHARCIGGREGGDVVTDGSDLADVEKECPICAPEHKMVENMFKSQIENVGRHDVFLKKLDMKKEDRFSVVADYFGKNLFVPKIV
ncbi:hypothetical protein CcCBS67573_g01607 [Chytriomyces confervae]|uniref:RING-type domain-containing protein n=1 Tax=Chytriomyces confervae TaxID=246404 RepID=A0A507FPZ4_9FUNG|nr:hypothetical protein CcCBS67573_g01607 [Chytriomyces confervae]